MPESKTLVLTTALILKVPGEPVPKDRPRVGPNGGHTTIKTQEGENNIRGLVLAELGRIDPESEMGYHVHLFFVTGSRTKDIDNLVKLVMDALNKYIWDDDRQVTNLESSLLRSATEEPMTQMMIYRSNFKWDEFLPPGKDSAHAYAHTRRVPSTATLIQRAQRQIEKRAGPRSRSRS